MRNYTGNVNIVNNNNIERRMLNTLLLSIGFLAFVYVLFLGNMVFNVVARRTMENDIRTLSKEVGDLELTYLSMSDKVDLTLSHSLGFTETKVKYATRKSLGLLNNSSPTGEPVGGLKITKNEI